MALKRILVLLLALTLSADLAMAQSRTFKIDVTGGIAEPLPVAMPGFIAETPAAAQIAADMTDVMRNNLVGTGLFRQIDPQAFISQITNFNAQPTFADWRAISAEALVHMDLGDQHGLLCFGSRDPEGFYPGQGTELLRFIGQILQRKMTPWLSTVK